MSSLRKVNIKNQGNCYPHNIINIKDLDLHIWKTMPQ